MKQDIMIIRESIGRIVSMLTLQKIKVTQRGSRAYVKYHPTNGSILELNIPYIPDDASEEFIAAIQGFLDHEVGHVLFSDYNALKAAVAEGRRVANLANIIEDVFIERKMTEAFRGSGVNLESTRKFYLEKIARPKIEQALKDGDVEAARGYATVAAFRAWGGQASAADFIKEPKIAELVKPVADKLGSDLIDAISGVKNSMEVLDLARKYKAKLEAPKPPPPPPPEKGMDREMDAMGKAGSLADALDSEEPPEDEDDDGPEEVDEGTTHAEADDSDKSGADESDKLDTDAGDEASGSSGDSDAESDDPEAADDEADRDSDADDRDDTDLDGTDADDSTDGDDAEMGTAAEDDDGKGSDEEGEGSRTKETDDESGEPAGSPSDSDEDTDSEPPDTMPEGESDTMSEPDPLADMLDDERDFDKDMSDKLSEDGKGEIASADYAVFSQDWDEIVPARMAKSKLSVDGLEHSIKDKVGVMQKQLERAIAAQARKAWNPGLRRGRISPGSLYRTSVGDDRVFRQRFETKARNTALSIVIDCSGSMTYEDRIGTAGRAAFALATVLERLKMNYEVIGFTTTYSGEMMACMQEDASAQGLRLERMGWGRIEPLYLPVFKPFNGRLDTDSKSRIAHLTERPGWLSQNVDGECVQIAARRLKQQRAERHVMLVLSDGEPACMSGRNLEPHLKKVVKESTAAGIEVVGIGIQTHAVTRFYPKHIVLDDIDSLATTAMAQLTKILLAE